LKLSLFDVTYAIQNGLKNYEAPANRRPLAFKTRIEGDKLVGSSLCALVLKEVEIIRRLFWCQDSVRLRERVPRAIPFCGATPAG